MTDAISQEPKPQHEDDPGSDRQQTPSGVHDGEATASKAGWNRSNKPFVVAAAIAAALALGLVVTLLSNAGVFSGGQDVKVSFTLIDADLDDDCVGTGGYGDIGPGTPVRLTDEAGALLGATSLNEGLYFEGACLWTVTISDVAAADFYSVEISDRGQITKSADELEADDWIIGVTLG